MPGEKTEKATPKKRKDQRKEGNAFQSKDISTVVVLFISFYGLKYLLPHFYEVVRQFLFSFFQKTTYITELTEDSLKGIETEFIIACATTFFPLTLVIMAVSVVTTGIQTRWIFNSKVFLPDFKKLNPLTGIKNLFSLKSVIELLKGTIKLIILVVFTYQFITASLYELVKTFSMDVTASSIYMFTATMKMFNKIMLAFVVLAAFDFVYQRWEYERKLKMSKQEIKEEYKQTEGDPQVKAKIRDIQRQRARSRMMQAVPGADVIIKNPTHFAVALKYDVEKNRAPIVVAKGQDDLALRIIRVGEENKVFVMENVALARALYASTELNHEIPSEYFGAIAEILVYIYKLNGKKF